MTKQADRSQSHDVESREYYDDLAREYHYSESYRRWPWVEYFHLQRRIGSVIEAVEEIAGRRQIENAVDVGCGDGILLPILSSNAKNVVALDLSPERLKMAEESASGLNNISYEQSDIMEDRARWEGKFDLVACSEVIEHVRDTGAYFERLAAMLAPGGALVLTTPSRWSVREKTLRLQQILLDVYLNGLRKRGIQKYKFFHIGLLSVSELRNLAARHFTDWQLKTVGFYVPVLTELGFTIGGNRWRELYRSLDEKVGSSFMAWANWTQVLVARKPMVE